MKKTWIAPGIEHEVLSGTAFNESQGVIQDGSYRDYEDCQWYPVYLS